MEGKKIDLNNKTIVVMYMLYFGDMVSITPFLEVLRREAKGSKIVLVIDSRFKESVQYNPNVDELIEVDRHGKDRSLSACWKIGKKIRQMHPDILITLHGTSRTSLMALAMKPGFWTGEPGTRMDSLFMDYPVTIETYNSHAVDKYLRVLSLLGVENLTHHGMRTYTCEEWDRRADEFFAGEGIKEGAKLVGLSVGSSTPEKNWPAENFGKVAEHFAGRGMIPVFFGVKSELPLIKKAVQEVKHPYVIAAGKLSMGEFMAAASHCSLFFTNDSGPMYVADSRVVPTIAMFGPSNAKFHHPLGKYSRAISSWDMPMGPEHVNKNIKSGNYVPLDKIAVEEVIVAGEEALRNAGC